MLNNVNLTGQYTLEVRKVDTDELSTSTTFDNLILNIGYDWQINRESSRYSAYPFESCFIGTGNTPPAVTQVGLDKMVTKTPLLETTISSELNANVEFKQLMSYTFKAGTVTGNFTEIGVGNNQGLFSRALITDNNGTPTAITILADEYLKVVYSLTLRVSKDVKSLGSISLAGVSHQVRASIVSISNTSDIYLGYLKATRYSLRVTSEALYNVNHNVYSYTGTDTGEISILALTGEQNARRRCFRSTFNSNQANLANGIRNVIIPTSFGIYQFEFTPAIAKTNLDTLRLDFNFLLQEALS